MSASLILIKKFDMIESEINKLSQFGSFIQLICDKMIKIDNLNLAESYARELFRFLYIKSMDKDVSPSYEVDQLWHMLLLFPVLYIQICNIISTHSKSLPGNISIPNNSSTIDVINVIDHDPFGGRILFDQNRRYKNLLENYHSIFPEGFIIKSLWSKIGTTTHKRSLIDTSTQDKLLNQSSKTSSDTSSKTARTSKDESFSSIEVGQSSPMVYDSEISDPWINENDEDEVVNTDDSEEQCNEEIVRPSDVVVAIDDNALMNSKPVRMKCSSTTVSNFTTIATKTILDNNIVKNMNQSNTMDNYNKPVSIILRDQSGEDMIFKVNKTMPLRKVMEKYADSKRVQLNDLNFLSYGSKVVKDDCCKTLEIEDGDTIDVIINQNCC